MKFNQQPETHSKPEQEDLYGEFISDARKHRLLAQEILILDATETVCEWLAAEGLSRADLAKRLGRSPAYVSQLLNGSRNMTLRTLADMAHVLNRKVQISSDRMGEWNRPGAFSDEVRRRRPSIVVPISFTVSENESPVHYGDPSVLPDSGNTPRHWAENQLAA